MVISLSHLLIKSNKNHVGKGQSQCSEAPLGSKVIVGLSQRILYKIMGAIIEKISLKEKNKV